MTRPLRCCARLVAALAVALALGAAGLVAAAPGPARAGSAAQAPPVASPEAATATVEFTGLVARPGPISVAELQRLPHETVTVTFVSGGQPEEHTFTGVRPSDALGHVGLAVDPEARNPTLRLYLVVSADDGYQVVFSGGEIDPDFGNVPFLLAREQDGSPYDPEDGALRLVAPGDRRGGRYVSGVVRIDVRAIDDGSA